MRGHVIGIFSATILLLFPNFSFAGQGTTNAWKAETWTERKISVIVAIVRDVDDKGDANRIYRATLLPIATIAGSFDPSLHRTLSVRFEVAQLESSIKQAPGKGATILAVLVPNTMVDGEDKPSDWIDTYKCSFMPDGAGLVVVRGIEDPQVGETLKRIQDARSGLPPKFIKEKANQPDPAKSQKP